MNEQMTMDDLWSVDLDGERDPRDLSVMDMVQEYAHTAAQPPNIIMSERLIREEYEELFQTNTPESELKELADLVYVLYGFANVVGYNLDEAVRRVHENNMQRMFQDDGTIKRREDGKIIKNPNAPKVELWDLT